MSSYSALLRAAIDDANPVKYIETVWMQNGRLSSESYVLLAVIVGSLCGFVQGYVLTQSQLLLTDENFLTYNISSSGNSDSDSDSQQLYIERFVSFLYLGEMCGALFSFTFSENFGRRNTLLCTSVVCVGVFIWSTFTSSASHLLSSRFLLGCMLGVLLSTAPVYIAEISSELHRGRNMGIFYLNIVAGSVVAAVVGQVLFYYDFGWRLGQICPVVVLLFKVYFLGYLPYSPRWLLAKKNPAECLVALRDLRRDRNGDVSLEFNLIYRALTGDARLGDGWLDIFLHSRSGRLRLVICVFIQVAQQLIGVQVITIFGYTVLKNLGIHSIQLGLMVSMSSALLGAALFVVQADNMGRRFLVLVGTLAVSLSWVGATLCAQIGGLEEGRAELYFQSYLLRFLFGAFLCLFAFCYACSIGPFSWVFCYEIFPYRARSKASALLTAIHFFGATISTSVLNFLFETGRDVVFCLKLFAGASFAIAIILFLFAPETKDCSLESMEELFRCDVNHVRCGCCPTGGSVSATTITATTTASSASSDSISSNSNNSHNNNNSWVVFGNRVLSESTRNRLRILRGQHLGNSSNSNINYSAASKEAGASIGMHFYGQAALDPYGSATEGSIASHNSKYTGSVGRGTGWTGSHYGGVDTGDYRATDTAAGSASEAEDGLLMSEYDYELEDDPSTLHKYSTHMKETKFEYLDDLGSDREEGEGGNNGGNGHDDDDIFGAIIKTNNNNNRVQPSLYLNSINRINVRHGSSSSSSSGRGRGSGRGGSSSSSSSSRGGGDILSVPPLFSVDRNEVLFGAGNGTTNTAVANGYGRNINSNSTSSNSHGHGHSSSRLQSSPRGVVGTRYQQGGASSSSSSRSIGSSSSSSTSSIIYNCEGSSGAAAFAANGAHSHTKDSGIVKKSSSSSSSSINFAVGAPGSNTVLPGGGAGWLSWLSGTGTGSSTIINRKDQDDNSAGSISAIPTINSNSNISLVSLYQQPQQQPHPQSSFPGSESLATTYGSTSSILNAARANSHCTTEPLPLAPDPTNNEE